MPDKFNEKSRYGNDGEYIPASARRRKYQDDFKSGGFEKISDDFESKADGFVDIVSFSEEPDDDTHFIEEDIIAFEQESEGEISEEIVHEKSASPKNRGYKYSVSDDKAKPRKNRKKHSIYQSSRGCLTAAIYTSVVCAVAVFCAFYILAGLNDMFALKKDDVQVQFDIPETATTEEISQILKESGVIDYPFLFKFFSEYKFDDGQAFRPGSYQVSTKTDYNNLFRELTIPKTEKKDIVKITFPEGSNVLQYAELLEDKNVCKQEDFLSAINSFDASEYDFLKNLDFGDESDRIYLLEGYLFPDTYEFYMNDSPNAVINKMLNNFKTKYEKSIKPKLSADGKTLDQIIGIASIVERESPDKEERPVVASVFLNRLANPSNYPMLQSDATRFYPYATKEDIPDILKDGFESKYDTTKISGYMPGAICNPGLETILAVLEPADTDYYFFYTDVNGKHYYAHTFSEHENNIAYCKNNGLAAQ